jgi:hypothetical protein
MCLFVIERIEVGMEVAVADGVGNAAQHERRGVAQPAFELAHDQVRMADRSPVGGVSGDHATLLAEVDHRGRDHRAVAERKHLNSGRARDRGRHERRTEIDSKAIRHGCLPMLRAPRKVLSLAP